VNDVPHNAASRCPSSAAEVGFHAGDGCDVSIDREALGQAFRALLVHFPKPVARVDALLVGDVAMDAAHQRFMQIAGTTDVMSFPAHDECDPHARVEADLYICTDVARREAAARGHALDREILLYAVHGTLHACGYRDDTDAAAAIIHAEEDRILAAGGYGNVYARASADEAQAHRPA
jgi:probable rRNA maturation factor